MKHPYMNKQLFLSHLRTVHNETVVKRMHDLGSCVFIHLRFILWREKKSMELHEALARLCRGGELVLF